MPDDEAVYLVSVDDGAENWQVIVFADDEADAMRVAKEAYEEEEGHGAFRLANPRGPLPARARNDATASGKLGRTRSGQD